MSNNEQKFPDLCILVTVSLGLRLGLLRFGSPPSPRRAAAPTCVVTDGYLVSFSRKQSFDVCNL